MKDKSLFLLVLALGCFWLVLNEIYGSQLISQFILKIIPKVSDD